MSKTKKATEEMLAAFQPRAMVYRGICLNLDTVTLPGVYITSADTVCENPPTSMGTYWKYAMVEVFSRNNAIFERIMGQTGMVYRYILNGEAKPWVVIA